MYVRGENLAGWIFTDNISMHACALFNQAGFHDSNERCSKSADRIFLWLNSDTLQSTCCWTWDTGMLEQGTVHCSVLSLIVKDDFKGQTRAWEGTKQLVMTVLQLKHKHRIQHTRTTGTDQRDRKMEVGELRQVDISARWWLGRRWRQCGGWKWGGRQVDISADVG